MMQIVIDIPEVFYEALKKTDEIVSGQRSGKTLMSVIYNAVANGTPLPKGHGRLIDANEVEEYLNNIQLELDGWGDTDSAIEIAKTRMGLDIVPTIIEADKTESEEV